MPKLKTNKSVSKRIRSTKSGRFKKMRAGKRHLLSGRSPKRKRHLRKSDLVPAGFQKQVRRLLPYA